jgi:hypothetical protein
LTLIFLARFVIRNAVQPAPAAVQPSISTFHCKVLSNLISPCYAFPCSPNPNPADPSLF